MGLERVVVKEEVILVLVSPGLQILALYFLTEKRENIDYLRKSWPYRLRELGQVMEPF